MRVLILDDNDMRHEAFAVEHTGDDVAHARTYSQFVSMLNDGRWDLIRLDHDLGEGQENADTYKDGWGTERYYDGYHAVMRILELPNDQRPPYVIVHSVNTAGAASMVSALSNAGIESVWRPFGT